MNTVEQDFESFLSRIRRVVGLRLEIPALPTAVERPNWTPRTFATTAVVIAGVAGVGWLGAKAVKKLSWTDRVAQNQQPDAPVSSTTRPSR